ncbi:type VI secretion system tube protein Hcp [Burkholderia ubonensis]|uniref:type VI secretion system tube protein Hcp n=1 Tax=Burkholderia ubonensis TaxID=101571 RepID=UPI0039F51C2B
MTNMKEHAMAQDIFLLTGIDGESQDARHPNEIGVLTWDWSVSQQSTRHSGAGGGAGKFQNPQGGSGGTVSMGYDIQANKAI